MNLFSPATVAEIISLFLLFGVTGLAFLTLAGFFGSLNHFFDICDQFRFQYFVLLALLTLGLILLQKYFWAGFALIFAGINCWVIYPIFLKARKRNDHITGYRLLSANILRKNRSFNRLIELVQKEQPDIIALVEPDQDWLDALSVIKEIYPFWHFSMRQDNYGVALFSRYCIEKAEVLFLTEKGVPTLLAEIQIDSHKLVVIVTHPPPPKSTYDSKLRDQQIIKLAKLTAAQDEPLILCGDFNSAPWTKAFRQMEKQGRLNDSTRRFGFQPTWPVDQPWLRVPIDHCLVSAQLSILNRRVGPAIGSDHFPVIIDFDIH